MFILGAPCGLNATAPLWQCGVTPGPWWVQNAAASSDLGRNLGALVGSKRHRVTDRGVTFEPFVAHPRRPCLVLGTQRHRVTDRGVLLEP